MKAKMRRKREGDPPRKAVCLLVSHEWCDWLGRLGEHLGKGKTKTVVNAVEWLALYTQFGEMPPPRL